MGDFNKFDKGRGGREGGGGRSFGVGERKFGGRPGGERSFGGGRSGGGFGGGRSSEGPREMFPATCGTCGENCEVPFKPTGKFPVFCKNCFKNQGGDNARSTGAPRFAPKFAPKSFGDRSIGNNFGGNAGNSSSTAPVASISKAQFEALSSKVDRILDILIAAQNDFEVPKEPKKEISKAFAPEIKSEVKIDKKVTNKAASKKAKGKNK